MINNSHRLIANASVYSGWKIFVHVSCANVFVNKYWLVCSNGAEVVPFADIIRFSGYSGWLETHLLSPLSTTGFTVADFVELERHARFRFIVRGKVRDVRGRRIVEADSYRLFRKSMPRSSFCTSTKGIRSFRNKIL